MNDFTANWKAIYINNGDIRLACYDYTPQAAGRAESQAILFLHGWPEAALSWRGQMNAMQQAGYHAIAFDLRGFGYSSAPRNISAYRIDHLIEDVQAVMDFYGYARYILCGHDWGGILLWHVARALAVRVSRNICISTPFVRQAPIDPVQIFKKRFGEAHYLVHFNEHIGQAEALFEPHSRALFRLLFRRVPEGVKLTPELTHIPARLEDFIRQGCPRSDLEVLSESQLDELCALYSHSGFHGGLNLYRNMAANWRFTQDWGDVIAQPTLMISPSRDLFLPPSSTDVMTPERVPDLTRYILDGCGHWAMWEQPESLNRIILDWLLQRA